MKIALNLMNESHIKLLDSYNSLKKAVNGITYSKNKKQIIGNYGNWEIKYNHDGDKGFVTADGTINMNHKKIVIKPGFIVDTEEKDTKTLFANMTNMLSDMVNYINNPEIVNREHNMFHIDIAKTIKTANRALKEIFEKQDKEMKDKFGF